MALNLTRLKLCGAPLLVLGAVAPAAAGNLPPPVIDDFSTGRFFRPTPAAIVSSAYGAAAAWGGSRTITTYGNTGVAGQPSYGQTSSLSNGLSATHASVPTALVLSAGYQVFPRVEVAYGVQRPFSYNVTGYQRLRVTFGNLEYPLNFNVQMASTAATGNLTDWGCNIAPTALGFGLTVDMQFSDFPAFDFKHVSGVYLILQASANWSVQKVELVTDSAPAATMTCHPPAP